MRWIKFTAAGSTSSGILEGEQIIETRGEPISTISAISRRAANKRGGVPSIPTRAEIGYCAHYLTLYPGDVIWMGTDGSSPNIKAGDVVEVEITGIGTLRNRFVAG